MRFKTEEIQNLIAEKTGCDLSEVTEDADIHNDLGCSGDDFDELLSAYAKKFNVKMDFYLWYFHTDEEGQNLGAFFFKPPNRTVFHISVTARLLTDFANKGHWDITYPEHRLPNRRYDIIINVILMGLFIAYLIYSCVR